MPRLEVFLNKLAKSRKISHRKFGKAIKALRIAGSPIEYLAYKHGAATIRTKSPWTNFIHRTKGFRQFGPEEFPGIDELVTSCQRFYKSRLPEQPEQMQRKPFFANILEPDDLHEHPEIMEFVLSEAVVRSVISYLGSVPRLMGIGLYVSPPNKTMKSSQLFHFDGDDLRQIKCFINLVKVDHDTGPFTFYDAEASALIEQHLGRPWGAHRYQDEAVAEICRHHHKHILTGPPGSAAFVDTARCIHFGSRTKHSNRAVLMFHYVTVPDLKIRKGQHKFEGRPLFDFELGQYANDRLRAMILAQQEI